MKKLKLKWMNYKDGLNLNEWMNVQGLCIRWHEEYKVLR